VADLDAYLDAASALLGLEIADAQRPGVARFLALAAEMAAVLEAVDLDDAALELAPVYLPPDPDLGPEERR
jgi:1-carboxybiuret hydrolase subunit AtzG-like